MSAAAPTLLAASVVAGFAGAAASFVVIGAAVATAVVLAVLLRPPLAAYLLIGLTPLIAGIDRGAVVPLVRPNEALALLLGTVLITRAVWLALQGRPPRIRAGRVDAALLVLAATASFLPVLWLVVRGRDVTADDLQHAVVLWKYLGVYLVVRMSITTVAQVSRCLWIAMASGAVVAVVAILQSLRLFGVPQLLAAHYAPLGDTRVLANDRGTSTLASSIAVGDVMTFCLALALGWLLLGGRHRLVLVALSGIFVLGALGSGQFSAVIGLVIGVAAVGWLTRRLQRAVVAAVPAAALGALLLQPVIERRISAFSSREGLPPSWLARLENLETFFWPELFRDGNFLLGVRPSARVAAPESWREWVYIESGHTWLLWSGGIPLLCAFFVFLWVALRTTAEIGRERRDAVGVAAVATFAALCVMGALTTLDAHLTLRGAGDLLFMLLALSLAGGRSVSPTSPAAPGHAAVTTQPVEVRDARRQVPLAPDEARIKQHAPLPRPRQPTDVGARRRGHAYVVAGTLLVAVLSALTVHQVVQEESPRIEPPTAAPFERVLVLSGSSLAAGTPPAAREAVRALGATGSARVVPGAGYARNDAAGGAFVVEARDMADLSVFDAIVVQGGEADVTASSKEVETATLHLIDYVHTYAPRASLTLVGPIPARFPAPTQLERVNDVVRDAAAQRGVRFIDAFRARWTSKDPRVGQLLAQAVAPPPTPPSVQRALVLSGSSLAAESSRTPSDAARLLGRSGTGRVVAGAGFARNVNEDGLSLRAALRDIPDLASFDTVVVQGGEADHAASTLDVSTAAHRLIDHVQTSAPGASLTLVGPIPATSSPPPSLDRVNDALRNAASLRGIPYLDAIEGNWTHSDTDLAPRLADAVRRLLADARS